MYVSSQDFLNYNLNDITEVSLKLAAMTIDGVESIQGTLKVHD